MPFALMLVVLAVVAMIVAARIRTAARTGQDAPALSVDISRAEIAFTAAVHSPAALFDCVVVSRESAGARSALFVSDATAEEICEAFMALQPAVGEGDAAVDLLVEWPGSGGRHPVGEFVAQSGPGSPRLDFRLAQGHGGEHPERGCIVRVASEHDSILSGVVPGSIADRLPRPGTAVLITLKLRTEAT